MSHIAIDYVGLLPVRPVGAKFVLFSIATRMDDAIFESNPSMDDISSLSGCSLDEVADHLSALLRAGILEIHVSAHAETSVYRIAGYEEWHKRRAANLDAYIKERFPKPVRT